MLIALLREAPSHLLHFFVESGGDITRLRRAIDERAAGDAEPTVAEVPFGDEVTLVLAAAQALAERQRGQHVRHDHVLWALTEVESTPFSSLLGASPETITKLRARLERT